MLVAITGTPGVGKSTVSKILACKFKVIDMHEYAEANGLFEGFDEDAGSYEVDVERLNSSFQKSTDDDGIVFMDGHLAHFVDCDMIIVLRCDPRRIRERLKLRGYDERKVSENVQAEVLDVILSESVETGNRVYEIDCTDLSPEETADRIERIVILGEVDDALPGNVDWSGEMEEWF